MNDKENDKNQQFSSDDFAMSMKQESGDKHKMRIFHHQDKLFNSVSEFSSNLHIHKLRIETSNYS